MSAFVLRLPKPKLPVFDPDNCHEEDLPELDPRPESVCYRGQTLAIMRHFFELSCQAGRLPSLLCREFFRAKVSHHAIPSFEEQIVFVRDVELCLNRLSDEHAEMIQLIGLYDFSREEIAAMLRRSRSWVQVRTAEAVDALAEIFLQAGLLKEDRPDRRQRQVTNRPLPADVLAGEKRPCASVEAPAHDQADVAASADSQPEHVEPASAPPLAGASPLVGSSPAVGTSPLVGAPPFSPAVGGRVATEGASGERVATEVEAAPPPARKPPLSFPSSGACEPEAAGQEGYPPTERSD